MKKKGFTLAELLGVLVIIALLLLLIIPGIINRLSKSGDEAKKAGGNIIYNAVDQYIKEHPEEYPPGKSGRYFVTIRSLIEDGKLAEPVIDVVTGEDVSDMSVMVTIYSSGNTDHEFKKGDECEEFASLPFIDYIVTPNGSNWVPKRTVQIVWPATDGDYKARYRIDNGSWIEVNIDSRKGGKTELIFDKSSALTPLEAQYVGSGGSTSNIISSKIDIVNVDSVPPTCSLSLAGTMGDNNWYRSNVTVSFGKNNENLKDDLSGVANYGISTSSVNTFGKISSKVQGADIANITYYGYVKDKAGNIGKCNVSFKKDATQPTCNMSESGTKGNNNWYRNNVVFSTVNDDNLSGVAAQGMSNNSTVNYNGSTTMTLSDDTKGITYYTFVKDKAGNTNQCSRTVKRDATAPTVNFGISGHFTATISCSDSISGVVGTKSWTVGLSGSSNKTVNASCTDYAGNVTSSSHTYKYSSCKYTVNTCQGGYDSVWSANAGCGYKCSNPITTNEYVCHRLHTHESMCYYIYGYDVDYVDGSCCLWEDVTVNNYDKYCCTGGYVNRWNSCKYGSPNECRGGFSA